MNKKNLITILLFLVAFSCKTHIESVTPEYPIEVYEFVCKQIDSSILEKIKESRSWRNYLVIRFEIKNDIIVDVAVLSKVLDNTVVKEIDDALINKQVSFGFIDNNRENNHISGLIKYKKLFKTCTHDNVSSH